MGATADDVAEAEGFIAPPRYSRHRPEATLLYELVADAILVTTRATVRDGRVLA